jgi:hypothetical protein
VCGCGSSASGIVLGLERIGAESVLPGGRGTRRNRDQAKDSVFQDDRKEAVMLKGALFFLGSLVVHLYTTFVLMLMWNWFVTAAFHVGDISFWLMYGLVLVVNLFQNPADKDFSEERRWKALMVAIETCVPEDQKELLEEKLAEEKSGVWIEAGVSIFSRAFANSVALGIGLLVHIFATI